MEYNRTLLGIYDKFNTWAYSNDNGRAVAEVYLIGAGIEVKAALVCVTDPNIRR
jgi:hypothetical protein